MLKPFESLGLNNVRTMIRAREAVDQVTEFSEYTEIYDELRSMMIKGAIVANSYADLINVKELTMPRLGGVRIFA